MKARNLACAVLISLGLSFRAEASALAELTELFLRSMSKTAAKAAPSTPIQASVAKQSPAMLRAAKILGEGASEAEQRRAAEMLSNVVIYELSAKGCTEIAYPICGSQYLADAIDARAIDIIKKRNDILFKLSTKAEGSVSLVDKNGAPILSSYDYRTVLDDLAAYASLAMGAAKNEKTLKGYSSAFIEKLKTQGEVEVEYDAKDNLATVTIKLGKHKGKVAKIDLAKIFDKCKYLVYGGGLAALGYGSGGKDKKSDIAKLQSQEKRRADLLKSLDASDRQILYIDAEAYYLVDKVREPQASRAKMGI